MNTGFVIGNGRSREKIDLNLLKGKGTTYGCNALYRDFAPDVLVSVDPRISNEIQNSGSGAEMLNLYSKFERKDSGHNAMYLATLGNHDIIYLLGFDFGSASGLRNNVYSPKSDKSVNECSHCSPEELFIDENNADDKFIRVVNKFSRQSFISIKEISVDEFLEIKF
jgi:hypothetical protein